MSLLEIAREARVRITDDDIDHEELDDAESNALIELMVKRGYTIGRDRDGRNE